MTSDQKETNPDEPLTVPGAPPGSAIQSAIPPPTKTPMYQAFQALRYQRQAVIRNIQNNTGRRLICYVSGSAASIDRDDTLGMVDLLHNVVAGQPLDFMLHTTGGDVDAAEKLAGLVRTAIGQADLRIIVPDFAKSAGTLMALCASRIVMSDTSELGPIDPQIVLKDGHGNLIRHSVQSYLDAYEDYVSAIRTNPNDEAAKIMLGKLDPATVKLFTSVRDRATKLAEKQLKEGMFQGGTGNFTKIAADLIDTKRWLSHGQVINWQDASQIGLVVEYLGPKEAQWQEYWSLYCLQRLAVGDRQKLFESDYASLTMDAG